MNLVILKGRATSDIELKVTASGTPVASFTIAVNRSYAGKGQERQTDFINCVAWRNTAEFISKWFSKGSMMLVNGEMQVRYYEDKNKNKRQAVEVIVSNVEFCESKNNTAQGESEQSIENGSGAAFYNDDDLPF